MLAYLASGFHDDAEVDAEMHEVETPICEVHLAPMVRQQGEYGEFWNFHQHNPDRSLYSYKPSEELRQP